MKGSCREVRVSIDRFLVSRCLLKPRRIPVTDTIDHCITRCFQSSSCFSRRSKMSKTREVYWIKFHESWDKLLRMKNLINRSSTILAAKNCLKLRFYWINFRIGKVAKNPRNKLSRMSDLNFSRDKPSRKRAVNIAKISLNKVYYNFYYLAIQIQ